MFISATVVDHRATLVRWWHDGAEYRAWSNANWLYLTGFADCKEGDRRFSTLLLAWNTYSAQLPEDSPYRIPEDLPATPGAYRVIQATSRTRKPSRESPRYMSYTSPTSPA
jgi:hypothetical protein